jgi:chromosome segregation ATPase
MQRVIQPTLDELIAHGRTRGLDQDLQAAKAELEIEKEATAQLQEQVTTFRDNEQGLKTELGTRKNTINQLEEDHKTILKKQKDDVGETIKTVQERLTESEKMLEITKALFTATEGSLENTNTDRDRLKKDLETTNAGVSELDRKLTAEAEVATRNWQEHQQEIKQRQELEKAVEIHGGRGLTRQGS